MVGSNNEPNSTDNSVNPASLNWQISTVFLCRKPIDRIKCFSKGPKNTEDLTKTFALCIADISYFIDAAPDEVVEVLFHVHPVHLCPCAMGVLGAIYYRVGPVSSREEVAFGLLDAPILLFFCESLLVHAHDLS